MGRTRYLFKKIRDTKGTFHANMGTIKNENGMDLTEAEDIKKRCGHSNQSRKRNKRNPNWKRRSKALTICR